MIDELALEIARDVYHIGQVLSLDEFWRMSADIMNCFVIKENHYTAKIEYSLSDFVDFVNALTDNQVENPDWNFQVIDGKIYNLVTVDTYELTDWSEEAKIILKEWEQEEYR